MKPQTSMPHRPFERNRPIRPYVRPVLVTSYHETDCLSNSTPIR